MNLKTTKSIDKFLIIVIIILALAIISEGGYYIWYNFVGTRVTPFTSLSATPTLIAPQNLSGYESLETGNKTIQTYENKTTSCELQFGTTDSSEVSGTDLFDIVNKSLDSAKKKGYEVTGPTATADLELKNSSNEHKAYSIPTVVFSMSTGQKAGTFYYSVAKLPNNNVVVISNFCSSTSTGESQKAAEAAQKIAQQITVKP